MSDFQNPIEERIASQQTNLLELAAHNQRALHDAYHTLELARHEIAKLRREQIKREIKTYTEEQMGVLLGVSEITMARLRKRHTLEHLRTAQSAVVYTQEQALAAFEVVTKNKSRPKRTG